MGLSEVVEILLAKLSKDLPGSGSQQKMAPLNRPLTADSGQRLRPSAVLILIYPKENDAYVVFMLRPKYDGPHSGQISFPGGKQEDKDASLMATALRETQEELGIDVSKIEPIGKLSPLIIPHSGFIVHPFVGVLKAAPRFYPNKHEVEKLIEVPLRNFLKTDIIKEFEYSRGDKKILAPYFDLEGEKLWGATSMIMSELIDMIAGND